MKQRGKNNWSPIPIVFTVCFSRRSYWILSELLTSDTQWNLHQHTEPSSLDLLRPVSTGRYTVFCDPSQRGTILYLLLKWPLWPSDTWWNPHKHMELSSLDLLRPVSTGRYTVFCDPSQRATILYLLLKWPLWPSDTQWNLDQHTEPSSLDLLWPVSTGLYCILRPVSTGHYTVFAFKMASMALWYLVKSAPTYGAEQSWSFAARLNGALFCILWPVSTGRYLLLKWH